MASYDTNAIKEAQTMELDPQDEEFREKILTFTDAASFEKRENYQNFLSKNVISKMDRERL